MKAANRFGAQSPSGAFSHMQQNNLPHRTPQHQPSNSSGLPQPSFSNAFASGNPNPLAPTGNLNGFSGGFGPSHAFSNGGTGLASREAVEGFNYGAQLQQQGGGKAGVRRKGGSKSQQDMRIRDVWASNLKEEMDLLEQLVEKYHYISMDTEFPGIVARPMGAFTTKADYHYQCLRCNVDLLKVIQLGISLFDDEGNSPPANLAEIPNITHYPNNLKTCPTTWQFNFQFSLEEDMYNEASMTFLQDAGLDLKRFEADGIDPQKFGARLVTSGLAHFDDVRWISFHSGYDFAYVVKLMNRNELPEDESEYRRLMNIYFPAIYDIKYMVQHASKTQQVNDAQPLSHDAQAILNALSQKGGLQSLADELHVRRIGNAHFAGSDALLTGKVFWEVKQKIFGGTIDPERYLGQIWGLNVTGTPLFSPQSSNTAPVPTANANANANAATGAASIDAQTSTPAPPQPSLTPNMNGATVYGGPGAGQGQGQSGQGQTNPPSTPASSHAGLVTSPGQQQQQGQAQSRDGGGERGLGSLTPSGGGGVFGAFGRFGKS